MIRNSLAFGTLVLLAGLGLGVACSGDPAVAKGSEPRRTSAASKPAVGFLGLGERPYHAAALAAVGSVHGTIKTTGRPPADSTSLVGKLCSGKPIPASSRQIGPAPTVVWIKDVNTGKPYPIEKRAELASDDCVLNPTVQAVVVGTTFNVFNDDKEIHHLVFTRLGTHDTLTVMPFFNVGQVVASERLAKVPGVVDVQCARHPWMHSYLVVFNNPYFAVTDDKGAFEIDSVPPGRYTVNAWHEGMTNPSSQVVQVAANGKAAVDLTLP